MFVFVVVVAGAALGGAAAVGSAASAVPIVGAGIGLIGVAGVFAVIYLATRLSFLLIPAALDGGEFGLTRSWQLTKGNFWRIFAIGLATLTPCLLVLGAAEFAILGPDFFVPDMATAKDATANLHHMALQMRAMQAHMPLLMGLSFVVSPVMYGLLFAPAAFAYRVLTGKAVSQ
jgi:hypothetical protein